MNIEDARCYAILHRLEGWFRLTKFTNDELADLVGGGCGPGRGIGDWIVPDTMWGVCVKPACLLHDVDYWLAKNKVDRLNADKRLRRNCNLINRIESHKYSPFKPLRYMRSWTYYGFVRVFGSTSAGC